MEVGEHRSLAVTERSQIAAARRAATDLGSALGFDAEDLGRVGLVATEIATNLVKHATGGEILLGALDETSGTGVELIAVDRGPGIASLDEALRDGYSSRGTSGTGLGAILRQATAFDVQSSEGIGTSLVARVSPRRAPGSDARLQLGGFSVAVASEDVSGDRWAAFRVDDRLLVLVSDGLGHGLAAADASRLACETFLARRDRTPAEIMDRLHAALRPTRGAAAAIAEIDPGREVVRFVGVGNVAGTILDDGPHRSLVSVHGTLGHDVRRIQSFQYPWPPRATLVLHSDGLSSHWTLDRHPGILARHPSVIAGALYRDARRARDDATVVVIRDLR